MLYKYTRSNTTSPVTNVKFDMVTVCDMGSSVTCVKTTIKVPKLLVDRYQMPITKFDMNPLPDQGNSRIQIAVIR